MEKNWILKLAKVYNHPAVILWRAIELRNLSRILSEKEMFHPILDLGCGEGEIARALFGKGVIDVGLDNEEQMVKKAEKSGIYRKVILGDACCLPFEKDSFNLIFSNCVIEHIPDINQVLSEVARILKKNGLFIFTVPSENFGDFLFFSRIFKKIYERFGFVRFADILKKYGCLVLGHKNIYRREIYVEFLIQRITRKTGRKAERKHVKNNFGSVLYFFGRLARFFSS